SGGEDFMRDWVYNIRPATDDSPYFYNFFRWKSIPVLRQTFRHDWFQKAEMGYLIVLGTLGEVIIIGAILILLPLLWLRRRRPDTSHPVGGKLATLVYFLLLGVTFMMVEMALIIRFHHFLGDPILSAGGVLSAFLVFSGLGSSLSRRIVPRPVTAIGAAVIGIGIIGISYELLLDPIFAAAASWPLWARFTSTIVLTAPLAFLMGWPFPNGLAKIQSGSPSLIPWAWSANGFASVAGTPITLLLATSRGFSSVMLVGVGLYVCAAVVAWKLPGSFSSDAPTRQA
ncbi:MAG: SAM-dependent methyltransferase, partial [Planctomycetota bacterium]